MGINTFRWILPLLFIVIASFDAAAQNPSSSHEVYRIGPNDVLRIQVFGEEELTVERRVDGDGKIDYPLLGSIPGQGKTIVEVQQYLTTRLAQGYLRNPKVSVSILRHRNFYVGGEVRAPGGFPYEVGLTVQKAIAMAGGLTEKSDKAGIQVKRLKGQVPETLALAPDALVMPDDLIYVAQAQKFYVNGEVRTPGNYSYEKGLTLHKAITMAGGFTDKAAKTSTKVLRIVNGEERTIEVSLDSPVLPEDIIVVPQRFF
jgi:protein involved in polysaccharide export with SLBB domain